MKLVNTPKLMYCTEIPRIEYKHEMLNSGLSSNCNSIQVQKLHIAAGAIIFSLAVYMACNHTHALYYTSKFLDFFLFTFFHFLAFISRFEAAGCVDLELLLFIPLT